MDKREKLAGVPPLRKSEAGPKWSGSSVLSHSL